MTQVVLLSIRGIPEYKSKRLLSPPFGFAQPRIGVLVCIVPFICICTETCPVSIASLRAVNTFWSPKACISSIPAIAPGGIKASIPGERDVRLAPNNLWFSDLPPINPGIEDLAPVAMLLPGCMLPFRQAKFSNCDLAVPGSRLRERERRVAYRLEDQNKNRLLAREGPAFLRYVL